MFSRTHVEKLIERVKEGEEIDLWDEFEKMPRIELKVSKEFKEKVEMIGSIACAGPNHEEDCHWVFESRMYKLTTE